MAVLITMTGFSSRFKTGNTCHQRSGSWLAAAPYWIGQRCCGPCLVSGSSLHVSMRRMTLDLLGGRNPRY